jgi:hypothetical protein|tara:strand:+ start:4490 stop:4603 length:114 start_codon:yes stop_codon:yes gene_type:complete
MKRRAYCKKCKKIRRINKMGGCTYCNFIKEYKGKNKK